MAQWLITLAALPEDMSLIPSSRMVAHNHVTRFQASSALFGLHGYCMAPCALKHVLAKTRDALTKKNTFGISPRLRQTVFWESGWPQLLAVKSMWWSVFDRKLKGGKAARAQRSHSILRKSEGIVINVIEGLRNRIRRLTAQRPSSLVQGV